MIEIPGKKPKTRAPRMQLLMAASRADVGPWCSVRYVKQIEVQDAGKDSQVIIEVLDEGRDVELVSYSIVGSSTKAVNIPQGYIRVRRVKGDYPLTVYAHSEL